MSQIAEAGGSMWVSPWMCHSREKNSANHAEIMPKTAPITNATTMLFATIGRKAVAATPAIKVM